MVTEVLLILFLLALVLFLCYFMVSFFTGAPFVTTPMSIVNEMIQLAALKKNDIVIDLGSGDGRILIAAAQKGALAKGWEINPFLVAWTHIIAFLRGVSKNVTVYCQTYRQASLHNASVVIFYNIPNHVPFIEKKLRKELKPGTKIISYKFPLSTHKLVKETPSGIFLYTSS